MQILRFVSGRNIGREAVGSAAGLTDRQRLFVGEYLIDRNIRAAAHRVGVSNQTAHTWLGKPDVQREIEVRMVRLEGEQGITVERIVLELRRILQADPLEALAPDGSVLPLAQWPEDLRRALSGMDVEELWRGRGEDREQVGVTKKLRFWSKTEASQQLMRHLGAFHDKVDLTARVSLAELIEQSEHLDQVQNVRKQATQVSSGGEISSGPGQGGGSPEIVAPGSNVEVKQVTARPPIIRRRAAREEPTE